MRSTSRSRWLLEAFAAWFSSPSCVWQTTALVVGWCVVETGVLPGLDPHGFWVLYVLTVYAAVTQPLLAYEARRGGQMLELTLANQARTMEALLVILRKLEEEVEETQKVIERLNVVERIVG